MFYSKMRNFLNPSFSDFKLQLVKESLKNMIQSINL